MCTRTKPERITPVRAMRIFRPIEEVSILWRRVRGAGLRPAAGLVATALMGFSCSCSKGVSRARTGRGTRRQPGRIRSRSTSRVLVVVGRSRESVREEPRAEETAARRSRRLDVRQPNALVDTVVRHSGGPGLPDPRDQPSGRSCIRGSRAGSTRCVDSRPLPRTGCLRSGRGMIALTTHSKSPRGRVQAIWNRSIADRASARAFRSRPAHGPPTGSHSSVRTLHELLGWTNAIRV